MIRDLDPPFTTLLLKMGYIYPNIHVLDELIVILFNGTYFILVVRFKIL